MFNPELERKREKNKQHAFSLKLVKENTYELVDETQQTIPLT